MLQDKPPPNPINKVLFPFNIFFEFIFNTIGIELETVFPICLILTKILLPGIFSFLCKLLIMNSFAWCKTFSSQSALCYALPRRLVKEYYAQKLVPQLKGFQYD